jgi:hypothetical protein
MDCMPGKKALHMYIVIGSTLHVYDIFVCKPVYTKDNVEPIVRYLYPH